MATTSAKRDASSPHLLDFPDPSRVVTRKVAAMKERLEHPEFGDVFLYAAQRLINYLYHCERQDYESCDSSERSNHLFRSVVVLYALLYGGSADPEDHMRD
jgi:hypothetical protein